MTSSLPVVRGTLDALVLKALTWGPMHGFGITRWVEERTTGTVGLEESALYQALYRLEARGLIKAEWGLSENNRRARYYRLTRRGRTELTAESVRLVEYARMLIAVLDPSAVGR